MKEYEVFISSIEKYEMIVEADSESEAIDKALELMEEDKYAYHTDSDGTEQAHEVLE